MTLNQAIVRLRQLRPDITIDPTDNPTLRKPRFGAELIVLGSIEVCLLTGKAYYCGDDSADPRDRSER